MEPENSLMEKNYLVTSDSNSIEGIGETEVVATANATNTIGNNNDKDDLAINSSINNQLSNYEEEEDELIFVNTEKLNISKPEADTSLKEKAQEIYQSASLENLNKFEALKCILEKQNKILSITEASKEKLSLFEDMAKEQLLFFQHNTKRYGSYLKLVKTELFNIQDLIRKIRKEISIEKK